VRRINKNFDCPPTELRNCSDKHTASLLRDKAKGIKRDCYKKSEPKLRELYLEKCAYCETEYLTTSDTWVEHYRPESKYYWLAYEWSNLLPTCTKCNRHKKAEFPLLDESRRVSIPSIHDVRADKSPLIDERPYILHPEIDNPSDIFEFETNQGIQIKGKDSENRGCKTIELCDLNRYEGNNSGLPYDRQKKVIDEIIEFIVTIDDLLKETETVMIFKMLFEKKIKNLIEKSENSYLEHTLLRKYLVISSDNFMKIVGTYLPSPQLQIIIKTITENYFEPRGA